MAGRFIQLYAEEIAHLASAKRTSTKKKCGVSGDAWAIYTQLRNHAFNRDGYRKYYCFPSYGGIARQLGWFNGDRTEELPTRIYNKVANGLAQLEEIGMVAVVKDKVMRLKIKKAYKLGRTPNTKLYHLIFYKELLTNLKLAKNRPSQKTMSPDSENYECTLIENYESDSQKTMTKEEERTEEVNNLNIHNNEETAMAEAISVETHGNIPVSELTWLAEEQELLLLSGSSFQTTHGTYYRTGEIYKIIKQQKSPEILKIFADEDVIQIQDECEKGSYELKIINQYIDSTGLLRRYISERMGG